MSALARRLSTLPAPEQERELLDLVRDTIALVLDYPSADDVDTDYTFKELGFDSLSGVEFRNQLKAATGVQVATTVVFDYPTPGGLAGHVRDLLFPEAGPDEEPEQSDEDIRRILATVPIGGLRESGLLDSLLRLADDPDGGTDEGTESTTGRADQDIDSMQIDDLIQLALEKE